MYLCSQSVPTLKVKKIVPGKRFKRVNGYNLFFSHYVRKNSEISPGMLICYSMYVYICVYVCMHVFGVYILEVSDS